VIEGYDAAREGGAIVASPPRRILRAQGRSPDQVLSGLISGAIPVPPRARGPGVWSGRAAYSTMLTPKGRIVTDLLVSRGWGDSDDLLLDLPEAGWEGARTHLRKYVPPRLAKIAELEPAPESLTLTGPRAPTLLSDLVFKLRIDAGELYEAAEGEEWIWAQSSEPATRVIHTADLGPRTFRIVGPDTAIHRLRSTLVAAGVAVGGDNLWDVLRLEHGRPWFGVELDSETMPAEAGIEARCIDPTKGCYTGQEVVVRIRDRGHVNRKLRGVLLGDVKPSKPDLPLFLLDGDRPMGTIRSFVWSPRFAQWISLAYLRREVEPPASIRIGTRDGPEGRVRALSDVGWVLVEGDTAPYPGGATDARGDG
jgi:folate-binding protein YgfZ